MDIGEHGSMRAMRRGCLVQLLQIEDRVIHFSVEILVDEIADKIIKLFL